MQSVEAGVSPSKGMPAGRPFVKKRSSGTMTQTYSREDASKLSRELIEHLKQGIRNTSRRDEWTQRNFALLREYAAKHGAESYPSAKDSPPDLKAAQFLWDFIACQPRKGILLAAESEHNNTKESILEDFEK